MKTIIQSILGDIRRLENLDAYVLLLLSFGITVSSLFSTWVNDNGIAIILTVNSFIFSYIIVIKRDLGVKKAGDEYVASWPQGFPLFEGQTQKIRAVSVSHSRFIRDNYDAFEELIKNGSAFSMGLVLRDPNGQTTELICRNSRDQITLEAIRHQLTMTISRLKNLKQCMKGLLQVKLLDHPIVNGIYEITLRGSNVRHIYVEFHGYKSKSGTQPRFHLTSGHPLFAYYSSQLDNYFEFSKELEL